MINTASLLARRGKPVQIKRFQTGTLTTITTVNAMLISVRHGEADDERMYRAEIIRSANGRPIIEAFLPDDSGIQNGDYIYDGTRTLKVIDGMDYYMNVPGIMMVPTVEDAG